MAIATPSAATGTGMDPHDYVFAVIDDPVEAEQAVQALLRAGFTEDALVLCEKPNSSTGQGKHTRPRQFIETLFEATSESLDSTEFLERYLRQVRLGHRIVNVYAPEPRQFERAVTTLEGYHAHAV